MDIEEMAARLKELENMNTQRQQRDLQTQFMDKYGSRFKGNEGIGVAILGELGRRGIDTSAADEAVQEILDQIRQEATQVLDAVGAYQQQVSDVMDKVNTIAEGVTAATGATPDAGIPLSPLNTGMPPVVPPMEGDLGGAPPSPEAAPPVDTGSMPPMNTGGPPPVAGLTGDATSEPIPPPVPQGVVSDERLKNFRAKVTEKRAQAAKPPSWKPNKDIVNALTRR